MIETPSLSWVNFPCNVQPYRSWAQSSIDVAQIHLIRIARR
jgi:hypothetical protein